MNTGPDLTSRLAAVWQCSLFGEVHVEERTGKLQTTAPLNGMLPVQGGGGTTLYVINLCASMAPIRETDKVLPGFESYRVYQVSRKEDGRVRYRLRLGFFSDEAEAQTALACVREHYPTAFAASLSDEDQRHTRGFAGTPPATPVAAPTRPAIVNASPAPAAPAKAPEIAPAPVAKPVGVAAKAPSPAAAPTTTPSDTQRLAVLKRDRAPVVELDWDSGESVGTPAAPTSVKTAPVPSTAKGSSIPAPGPVAQRVPIPPKSAELTLAVEPATAVPSANTTPSNTPFHVGKGVDIPAVGLSLEPESASPAVTAQIQQPIAATKTPDPSVPASAAASMKPAAAKAAATPTPQKPKLTPPAKSTPAPAAKSAAAPPEMPAPPNKPGVKAPARHDDAPALDMDSTQTIRALTAEELDDENQAKWFAVQLAVSEQTINLDTMPHLDIFSAYRLYSVATASNGKILHHMRIGFFKEQVSAEAVSGYLKTFFGSPTVLRISVAEYNRFAEAPPPPAHAPEPKAKVIELAAARDRTPAREVPVVTMEVTPTAATGRYPKPGTANTGTHHQLPANGASKVAAKSGAPAVRRSEQNAKTGASGRHRTLNDALIEEARLVELSESAIRQLPKNSSLLSKLFGKK
jgi:hypothetical protein